ncbi:TraM recognition site of TraD and TraG [Tenacibaculum sp. MAR_2009_124]|uniref:type IV secretory system conjugative DNA transfer family protein n=1 Tax=Tenacibaculum sp. MAR_2009_124 TaxID=1250059 RepID=UPI000899AC14|nr:type IV secretory system conjugative DNA transfer family protein [Tenacibaculum sp. MAR_2009_124]SEC64429.1 TraM recognition site of TraD and TraG [Tenacibaculum sp. MAR_2009_124]
MNSKTTSYSGMFLSVVVFLMIAYITYYPLIIYHKLDGFYSNGFYIFFQKFEILKKPYHNKLILLMFIIGSVFMYRPKKREGVSVYSAIILFFSGISFLFLSDLIRDDAMISFYESISFYSVGFILTIIGCIKFFEVMAFKDLSKEDPFNDENETFQQTEQKIENEYSVNIPYLYRYQGKMRKGWINFVNLFRALLIIGTPGSGKSFAFFEEIIEQMLQKFFTLLIYDFKFDSLSRISYNYLEKLKEKYKDDPEKLKLIPTPYFICFDNIEKSHRCNPINPYLMTNQTDAGDAANILMKNLNKEWIKKTDFFAKSAISFVSGLIWYLKKKSEEKGKNLCTLPHVITLSSVNVEYLLEIMLKDMEVRSLMIPFKDALEREANQQLSGQTASAQISLSQLSNKELFYVMSGNDFSIQINDPNHPKMVCIQNNPDRQEIYSAPIGLYINKILQVVNKKGMRPLGLILDELPTIFIMGLRKVIDTGRSNFIATILGIQSISQLFSSYGKEESDVVYDNCANAVCGSAKGETAKRVSQIFGKIHQKKTSHTINKNDTSTSVSTQMQELLPVSKITAMSTGDFAGIVADTFKEKIAQKLFYGSIMPNMESKKIQNKYEIPIINEFRDDEHEEEIKDVIKLMEELDFYDVIVKIDTDFKDYILFYNQHILDIAQSNYEHILERQKFVGLIKDMKLFNHLQLIKDYNNLSQEETQNLDKKVKTKFIGQINSIIDSFLVQKKIDKLLDDNFIEIIIDVDELVKEEYYAAKGKLPEHTIFDKDKISEEIETSINESESLATNFMNDMNKAPSKKLVDMFGKSKSELNSEVNSNDDIDDDNIIDHYNTDDSYHIEYDD